MGNVNRRQALRALLGGGAVAASVDVERLLWTPGKLISIPSTRLQLGLTLEEYYSREILFGSGSRIALMSATLDRMRWVRMTHLSNEIGDCNRISYASPYGLSDKTISKRLLDLADLRKTV